MHLPRDEAIAAHVEERAALPAHFDGCGLCGLAAAHPPDVITLAERPHAVAILARYALRRGHVLVLTRRHVERYRALSWAEHRDVQRLTWEAARAIERALSPARVFAAALGAPRPVADDVEPSSRARGADLRSRRARAPFCSVHLGERRRSAGARRGDGDRARPHRALAEGKTTR